MESLYVRILFVIRLQYLLGICDQANESDDHLCDVLADIDMVDDAGALE